jgi:hypothetical protein
MYFYLATPYSIYHKGRDAAFDDATYQASLLVMAGVPVFCPITHTHPMVPYIPVELDNHETWLTLDEPMMAKAEGLIVCQMEGWQESVGVTYEIETFRKAGKPIVYMTPGIVPPVLLPGKRKSPTESRAATITRQLNNEKAVEMGLSVPSRHPNPSTPREVAEALAYRFRRNNQFEGQQ